MEEVYEAWCYKAWGVGARLVGGVGVWGRGGVASSKGMEWLIDTVGEPTSELMRFCVLLIMGSSCKAAKKDVGVCWAWGWLTSGEALDDLGRGLHLVDGDGAGWVHLCF